VGGLIDIYILQLPFAMLGDILVFAMLGSSCLRLLCLVIHARVCGCLYGYNRDTARNGNRVIGRKLDWAL